MSKRNRREHGRIISVETLTRGDALAADVAAGATSITVNDAGDFDEDGGWLYIGAQTVEYTACDDDTGLITLATALTAAGEQGDPVQVWSDLYDEVVDYQLALVELDGEYDNPDPVVAEVAEGVGDLPEGDRGKAGESCTLLRVADDEWEVVGVGGRPRASSGVRWEQDDTYVLTTADITAGTATMPLTYRPAREALTCVLAGVPQRPTNWTINYDAQTLTIPLSGWEKAGDVLWVHYAYRKGVTTPAATEGTSGYVAGIMARSPVGYWRQGEPSGTTMVDSSGNGRDGTYVGSPTLAQPGLLPGDTDTAVAYTGGFKYGEVDVATYPSLKSAQFTIELAWKPSTSATIAPLAGRYDESSIFNSAWKLRKANGTDLNLIICNGGTKYHTTAAGALPTATGTTYLIGATYDGTTVKLFVNGVKVATGTPAAAMQLGTRNFRVAAEYSTSEGSASGVIDEVSLCDYACSEAEMAASFTRFGG